jgi:hypothetical protein
MHAKESFVRNSAWITGWLTVGSLALLSVAGCSSAGGAGGENLGSVEQELGTCVLQALPIASATASSSQAGTFEASRAIDGNTATRWSSGQGAPQWLRLDLGQRAFISSLSLDWETAYSPSYEVQVSDDGVNFARLRRVVASGAGVQQLSGLDVSARYVRIQANQVSGYGSVSLREVGVVGAASTVCSATPVACGDSVRLAPVATQASSTEFSYTPASAGADDVYSTRWSSSWSDGQWLALDLGSVARVDQVRITWQAAYATSYAIETATSLSGPWSQAKLVSDGVGGVETVPVAVSTRFLRLKGITRATGYGISLWDVTVLGSKDMSCSCENLLTRGWDPASVQDIGCPGGTTCGTAYSLDPANPNVIGFLGGSVCPVSGGPSALTFSQNVTATSAGNKFRLSVDISNYSGFIGSSGCSAFGNTTFVVTLAGNGATSYTPAATYLSPIKGCVAGSGTLQADLELPFAAGETKTLSFGMTPVSFGVGSCGGYAESFTVTNAKLVKLQ